VCGALEAIASQLSVEEPDGSARGVGELISWGGRMQVHAPALVRRGTAQVVISTGRKSPLFAQRLGERLEASIGPEYRELANVLSAMRVVVRYHEESSEVWQAMFEHLVEASCRPLLADVTTAAHL
jgi:siroheme synthase (precorrin-2 oxidase/ferrochelatase)